MPPRSPKGASRIFGDGRGAGGQGCLAMLPREEGRWAVGTGEAQAYIATPPEICSGYAPLRILLCGEVRRVPVQTCVPLTNAKRQSTPGQLDGGVHTGRSLLAERAHLSDQRGPSRCGEKYGILLREVFQV